MSDETEVELDPFERFGRKVARAWLGLHGPPGEFLALARCVAKAAREESAPRVDDEADRCVEAVGRALHRYFGADWMMKAGSSAPFVAVRNGLRAALGRPRFRGDALAELRRLCVSASSRYGTETSRGEPRSRRDRARAHALGKLAAWIDAVEVDNAAPGDDPVRDAFESERDRADALAAVAASMRQEADWVWLGDGFDDLPSMSDGMVVRITAGELRAIASPPARPWPKEGPPAIRCLAWRPDSGWFEAVYVTSLEGVGVPEGSVVPTEFYEGWMAAGGEELTGDETPVMWMPMPGDPDPPAEPVTPADGLPPADLAAAPGEPQQGKVANHLALIARLDAARGMIAAMCRERRPPKMSVPARPGYDEDLLIDDALNDAIKALGAPLTPAAAAATLERVLAGLVDEAVERVFKASHEAERRSGYRAGYAAVLRAIAEEATDA